MDHPTQNIEENMDLGEELKKLKDENSSLNRRLLGVNELARLLQDKTETCTTLQEKNKRLEIAVVRLENRCHNFEKKMKLNAAQFSSLPSAGANNPKSFPNSPFIPGPSRQILESLMRDNHELKKTINNLLKGGPAAYKEAVKMNQLEEVIDQKNDKIDLLQKQIEDLTDSHSDVGVATDQTSLKRQILKMEQAMKVKDRFCTLLSERVSQLETELNESTDGGKEPEDMKPKSELPTDHTELMKDLETKEKTIEDLHSQLDKERNEKRDIVSKSDDNARQLITLESEIVSLTRRVDSLSTYNNTLVSEKMDLSGDIMRLNEKLQQEQSELRKLKEDNVELKNKNDDLSDDVDALNNKLMEANFKLGDLQNRRTNQGSSWSGHMMSGSGTTNIPKAYNSYLNKGQEVAVDGPGPKIRSSPEPQHCAPSSVTYMYRKEVLSRGLGSDSTSPESTVPLTATTPTVTSSNTVTRSLELHQMQQQQFQQQQQQQQQQSLPPRSAQTPGGYGTYSTTSHHSNTFGAEWPSYRPQVNMPHNVSSYHSGGSNSPLPHPPGGMVYPSSGTIFSGGMPPNQQQLPQPSFTTNASVPGMPTHHSPLPPTPGSGYMTHPSEFQRYYSQPNPPPPQQRRPSPPGQTNASNGPGNTTNQHYFSGPQ